MNSNTQTEKPNYKLRILLLIIFIAVLIVLFLLEKAAYSLVHLVFYYDFLTLLVFLFLHVLLVRCIVLIFLFPASNFFVKRVIRNENGKAQAAHMQKKIKNFKANIEHLKTTSDTNLNSLNLRIIRLSLKQLKEIITAFIRVYTHIQDRFQQSDYQKKFAMALRVLNDNLNDSGLELILDDVWKDIESSGLFAEIRDVNLDRHIKKIITNAELIEDYIKDFQCKRDWRQNLKNFWSNDTFGSLYQYRIEATMRFDVDEFKVVSQDGSDIDIMLLKSDFNSFSNSNSNGTSVNQNKILFTENEERFENKHRNRNVVIICGPNGAPFEILCKNFPLDSLYLDNNIDVLLWNYRGFGLSTGSPSFDNIQKDAECVVDFARKQKMWDKIGVHGISIGGLASCHVAGKNLVDLVIADRTFACIEDIVKTFPFGSVLSYLYKFLFFHHSHNVDKILSSKCFKVYLSDPLDSIVKDEASLKTGIARRILSRFNFKKLELVDRINYANMNTNNENAVKKEKKKDIRSILDITLSENEYKRFIDSVLSIFRIINQIEEGKKEKTTRDQKKNSQTKSLLNVEKKQKTKIKYTSLQNKIADIPDAEIEETIQSDEHSQCLDIIIRDLMSSFTRFESAGDSFSSLKKFGVKNSFRGTVFINNFFSNMFIWGCIKTDNDEQTDKLLSHKEIAKRFKYIFEDLEVILNQREVKEHEHLEIIQHVSTFRDCLIKLEKSFFPLLFKQSLSSSFTTDHSDINLHDLELSLDMENLNLGSLIPLSCGHNGNFNDTELSLIKYELIKAKFI